MQSSAQEVKPKHVLIVIPWSENPNRLLKAVVEEGHVPLMCHSFEQAQEVMKYENIQIIICHDRLPKKSMEEILEFARRKTEPAAVIVASRTGEWDEYLEALQQGAFDYLALPPRPSEVRRVLQQARAEVARPQVGSALAVPLERPGMQTSGYDIEDRSPDSAVHHYLAAASSNSITPRKIN